MQEKLEKSFLSQVEKKTRRVLGFSILLAWLVEDVMLILHHII